MVGHADLSTSAAIYPQDYPPGDEAIADDCAANIEVRAACGYTQDAIVIHSFGVVIHAE
jgi:hypothetical protein